VVHSRDDEGVGGTHKITSPKKPAYIFPDYDGGVLVSPTKSRNSFYRM